MRDEQKKELNYQVDLGNRSEEDYKDLYNYIEGLLAEQEKKHKKEMKEIIKKSFRIGVQDDGATYTETTNKLRALKEKYNLV